MEEDQRLSFIMGLLVYLKIVLFGGSEPWRNIDGLSERHLDKIYNLFEGHPPLV